MKKYKLVIILLSAVLIAAFRLSLKADAAEGLCEFTEGNNIGLQNYSKYASPVSSYLYALSDGTIMQVQLLSESKKNVVVTYYDSDYNALSQKRLSSCLPIAGGFYALGDYYYILSGDSNSEQDNSKEVYSVAKYDLEWDLVDETGLYGANTVFAFEAGSARFASNGKYLFVRTCHTMYKSSDGLNHQANVTFSVDTDTMKISDSMSSVANSGFGYCSHSFNQFIGVDENVLFAADHGDAYPRSIALFIYEHDCSDGCLGSGGKWGNVTRTIDMLSISGNIGNNTTKASIGGLEFSSTNYIIAGNSVDMSDYYNSDIRNVFVSSISKDTDTETGSPELNILTDYSDGTKQASTPILVKTGEDRFLVLFEEIEYTEQYDYFSSVHTSIEENGEIQGILHYMELNGQGKQVGKTYTMKGHLSDCKPVIINGKAVWYVWSNEQTAFFEIDLKNLDETKVTLVINDHDYNFSSLSAKGTKLTEICSKCGKTHKLKVPNKISIQAYTISNNGRTHTWTERHTFTLDESFYIKHTPNNDNYMPIIEVSDPEVASVVIDPEAEDWDEYGLIVTPLSPGKCTITIKQKYNDKTARTFEFTIKGSVFSSGSLSFEVIDEKSKKAMFTGTDDKSVNTLKIPSSVQYNGITYNVTDIAPSACYGMGSLQKVIIPKYVEKIGNVAFDYCTGLKKVVIKSKRLKEVGSNAFSNLAPKTTFDVPKGKEKSYKNLLISGGAKENSKIK